MGKKSERRAKRARTFLSRLAGDVRGNTLAIMAAALIPLAGMVGGGVDLSRMYIVKTRLQHACDAGALAGRKAMGGGAWSQDNYYPKKMAERFFIANINDTLYGADNVSKTFTESAGKVAGQASAQLPMTLMRIFGQTTKTLTVTCDAEMRLPNTDVMFVLDTTGSMGDPQPGDSQTKLSALKESVKCFYEIMARLDTNANCTTGTPSGGTSDQVQIRFGFVPYATNVNVGYLLKPQWIADSWPYQSRELVSGGVDDGGYWDANWQDDGWHYCSQIPSDTQSTKYQVSYTYNKYLCRLEHKSYHLNNPAVWNYGKITKDISALKSGSTFNHSFQLKIGDDGTMKTIKWDGCIEERATVRKSTYYPIPAGANDLNIDMVPTGASGTQWGPALPDLIYTRKRVPYYNGFSGYYDIDPVNGTTTNYGSDIYYACPTEATRLSEWKDPVAFDNYVDSLKAEGNTYHDIGLLWGARLMSPDGIFAADNKLTAKGGEIERHLIFMTDGDACTGTNNYTAYGVNWFDRRETDPNSAPSAGCGEKGTLTQQVNARTEALCTAIKNKNITLWVIAFGDLETSTENRLQKCATPGRYFKATNAAALQSTFKQIADEISQLRLTK
ncbi:pilus assembly protein [Stakelama marina]|uniref:TadE/TadG family protein n=1 Tax=Stakelama marina TaxID=2826939 RepID=A0A8T4IAD2_9SPHN|nr:TadE/TadG family type IV pilus assembly protein [Stakelama marina]MBR0551510.1 TadE/TadG family protein [Stakelama marina]